MNRTVISILLNTARNLAATGSNAAAVDKVFEHLHAAHDALAHVV